MASAIKRVCCRGKIVIDGDGLQLGGRSDSVARPLPVRTRIRRISEHGSRFEVAGGITDHHGFGGRRVELLEGLLQHARPWLAPCRGGPRGIGAGEDGVQPTAVGLDHAFQRRIDGLEVVFGHQTTAHAGLIRHDGDWCGPRL